ncbi:MAG TPA: hypothetical protein VHW45_02550 [Candidatus Sulfotelmatobacter sp.]|nr:hypothetical protein [Candidatus Sulfotelmatobacter sp.]
MCLSGGDDSPSFATHGVSHHDFDAFHHADSENSILAMSSDDFLKDRTVEDAGGILKVDKVLCKVGLALAFVPLKKHGFSQHVIYMHKVYIH